MIQLFLVILCRLSYSLHNPTSYCTNIQYILPKKLLECGVFTPVPVFCLKLYDSRRTNVNSRFVPLTHEPGSICASFQGTGSTPDGFQKTLRGVYTSMGICIDTFHTNKLDAQLTQLYLHNCGFQKTLRGVYTSMGICIDTFHTNKLDAQLTQLYLHNCGFQKTLRGVYTSMQYSCVSCASNLFVWNVSIQIYWSTQMYWIYVWVYESAQMYWIHKFINLHKCTGYMCKCISLHKCTGYTNLLVYTNALDIYVRVWVYTNVLDTQIY